MVYAHGSGESKGMWSALYADWSAQGRFSWNTLSATAYWSSRVSLEALFTSAHVINEIIVRDVAAAAECVGRRPNLDPNATHRGGLPAGVMASRAHDGA